MSAEHKGSAQGQAPDPLGKGSHICAADSALFTGTIATINALFSSEFFTPDRHDFLKTLAEACQKTDWQGARLLPERKNDPGKMAVAVRLRRETTLSVKQIAARVHLGTSYTANKRIHEAIKALPRLGI